MIGYNFLGRPAMWVICFRGARFSDKNGHLERSPNFSLDSITIIAPLQKIEGTWLFFIVRVL